VQEAWKRIDDLEQKCAAARAEGASAKGLSERAHRDSQARVDRLQVRHVEPSCDQFYPTRVFGTPALLTVCAQRSGCQDAARQLLLLWLDTSRKLHRLSWKA
jgi:hypothetical protein